MRLFDQRNAELIQVMAIEPDGGELVLRGRIFAAMPIVARLRPEEARAALGMLSFRTWLFLMTLPFRRRVGGGGARG